MSIYLEYVYYEGIYIFITSVEIFLLSSEPNPYELAFIYEMLIFYNFMTANCKITQVLIEFKLYLVDFILVNNRVISLLLFY